MTDKERDILLETLAYLAGEVQRLKEGRFTPEEFQNLCHMKQVQDGFESFAQGCREYQKKLFGKCDED